MTTPDQDPIHIGRVALTVHDLAGVGAYYEEVVGLERLSGDREGTVLGAGGRPLLELRRDRAARRRSPREAGLFHTASLLPSRDALGRWIGQAITAQTPVQGLSDHLVSEAVYLADPEGNGIEIYADRPREDWIWQNGTVEMVTEPLDVADLAAAATGPWQGAPAGTIIGHVHLQVGAVPEAEAFYRDRIGLDVTAHYPGATFLSSGGYHHHLAANIWNSRGAGQRQMPSTGLSEMAFVLREGARFPDPGEGFADPWGTPLRFLKA